MRGGLNLPAAGAMLADCRCQPALRNPCDLHEKSCSITSDFRCKRLKNPGYPRSSMNVVPTITLTAVGLAWIAVAMPLAAAADNAAAAGAIRAGSAAFLKAYNAGDADAVLTHFEEGAVVMPPGALTVRGGAEIRQFVEKGIAGAKASGITLALGSGDEVGVSGDLGWHSGSYSASKAGATTDSGKYLEAWHKSGGRWRMIRRIWNSNTPAHAPVAAPAPK